MERFFVQTWVHLFVGQYPEVIPDEPPDLDSTLDKVYIRKTIE
jgi:hypothetical protein